MTGSTTQHLLEHAWVDGAVRDDVLVEIEDGRFTRVDIGGTGAPRLAGLTLPGFANCHSHAFHRALRGRTQRERGTFWTWREQMYDVAARLDPDSYFRLARATYREMAAAGITTVGEFHYLHHQPDGTPYDDPNAMGLALIEAAKEAGLRICLLDTCYLSSGFGKPVEGVQVRFSDGDIHQWWRRTDELDRLGLDTADDGGAVRIAAAVHSVRAAPADAFERIGEWCGGLPLHVHLSEQVAENEACLEATGVTPARLLLQLEEGSLPGSSFLSPAGTVIHATHLSSDDIELLGTTGTNVCMCPTTERDLADGIGPARRLQNAGARITLGTDSNAVIDMFEEMRGLELDERLATQRRGHWSAAELIAAATAHDTLGFTAARRLEVGQPVPPVTADAGRIQVGLRADLVTVDIESPRTAGTGGDEHTAVFAATAADITQVVADGRVVFTRGDEHDIGRELDEAISAVLS